MKRLLSVLGVVAFAVAFAPTSAWAQGAECPGGLCGTPNQSGGGCGCGCGCGSILVAFTDQGVTYQYADDFDADGWEDEFDNCPFKKNDTQVDADGDAVGDDCDVCVSASDPDQGNLDGDELGDACDPDMDGDGIDNLLDTCLRMPNADGVDTDGDLMGDACDDDDDDDGLKDWEDDCRLGTLNVDACDDDLDHDGIFGNVDNCPGIANPGNLDSDGDGIGDLCDSDMDGDDIPNFGDNCPSVHNPSQLDVDGDMLGDAGNWSRGDESCDLSECYVVAGNAENCLDPHSSFNIYLSLLGQRIEDKLQVGNDIIVLLYSNRLGQQHNWTASFTRLPSDSETIIKNARGAGVTALDNPAVTGSAGNITFSPDEPGTYEIQVTASLPQGDALGPAASTFTIVAEVEGESQGGCAAASGGLAALALGLLFVVRRRRS